MSGDSYTLKECLVEYLTDSLSNMPTIEAQIIEYEPVKISDDGKHYLEISGISEDVLNQVYEGKFFKLILNDWEFKIAKVPNSTEYYIDVKATSFDVVELSRNENPHSDVELVTNVLNDVDVKYLFRQKKKNLEKKKQKLKSGIKSPYKSKNATPIKGKRGRKIIRRSPTFGTADIGAIEPVDTIGIGDILTTGHNFGRARKSMIKSPMRTPNKSIGGRTAESTAIKGSAYKKYHGTNFEKIHISNMEGDDESVLGKRNIAVYNATFFDEPKAKLKVGDILKGFRKKQIKYSEVVFNKETVDYLKRNIDNLLTNE